jgi:hypothetical protein
MGHEDLASGGSIVLRRKQCVLWAMRTCGSPVFLVIFGSGNSTGSSSLYIDQRVSWDNGRPNYKTHGHMQMYEESYMQGPVTN